MTVEPASDDEQQANAEHIALCHPGNIAALIARIRQAEAEREIARAAAAWHEMNWQQERDLKVALIARVKVMGEALAVIGEAVLTGADPDRQAFIQMIYFLQQTARAARKGPTNG